MLKPYLERIPLSGRCRVKGCPEMAMHRLHDEHGNEIGVYCVLHADMALEALMERIQRLTRAMARV